MKMHLIFLCAQAKMNRDPAVYANMVLDNTPDEKLDELVAFMGSPEAIDNMAQTHKAVANYREWFERLGKEIMAQLVTDDELENEPLISDKESEELTGDEKPVITGEVITDPQKANDVSNEKPINPDTDNGNVIGDS